MICKALRVTALRFWCVVVALVLFSRGLSAQITDLRTPALRVHVSDAQNQPVPGATCSLSARGSLPVTGTTDEQGFAVFATLSAGTYIVRVDMPGFETAVLPDVLVRDNTFARVDLVLTLAEVSQSVTVEAPGRADTGVSAGSAPPAGNLFPSVLRLLPITIGSVQDALPLVPGVVRSATGEISMKGATDDQSAFLLNGLNASDPATGGFRLAQRIEFDTAPLIRERNREYVGFAQDRWSLGSNLTIDLGLRYEDQRIADAGILAPRAGFAWAPGGGATVIRGGVGYFYGTVLLNIRSFGQYPARTVTRFAADGVTVTDSTRLTPLLSSADLQESSEHGPASEQDAFVPENLTWNVQVDRKIRPWLACRTNLLSSDSENIYIVKPQEGGHGEGLLVLSSAGHAKYRAVEITGRAGGPEHAITVSYTRSRSRGDLNDFNASFGDFALPIVQTNQYSQTGTDVPNRLLIWGTLILPWRTTVAPVIEVRTGFPYTVLDAAHDARFPRFIAADLELARDFHLTGKYAVRLSLRGFNLTNHFNPRDVHANVSDPAFGQFLASYRRYFTGGFDVVF